MVHRHHAQHRGPYKHAARRGTGRTLIMRPACLCASGPVHPFLKRASGFFFFLTFLFRRPPSACLKLKDSSALSVYVMETDESQGKAGWPLHFGSLAEVQQSPSDPPPEPGGALGGWQGSEGFPFRFCFLQRESAGDQIRKNYDTLHLLATCSRQINNLLAHFSFFIFFLFAYPSNFNTILEKKRDGKTVWLFFFANDLLKSKMFLEKSQRWYKSPQLVRKLEWNYSKFTILVFHVRFFSSWVPKIYIHFCETPGFLTLWSFLQVQSHVFENQELNFWNLSVELTNVTPKARCSHLICFVMKHNKFNLLNMMYSLTHGIILEEVMRDLIQWKYLWFPWRVDHSSHSPPSFQPFLKCSMKRLKQGA